MPSRPALRASTPIQVCDHHEVAAQPGQSDMAWRIRSTKVGDDKGPSGLDRIWARRRKSAAAARAQELTADGSRTATPPHSQVRSGRGSQSGPHDTRPTSVCLEDWKSESASGETAATIPKFPCVGLELCAVVTSGQQQGQRLRSDRARVSSAAHADAIFATCVAC